MPTIAVHQIGEPRRIRALASPIRQDIVDYLESTGAASVSEIARSLGRRPDSLYYHLKLLTRVSLVKEVGTQGEGRALESIYDVVSRPLRIQYRPESSRNVAAVQKMSAAMLRSAERSFDRAFDGEVVTDGPARNVWTGRFLGRLSPKELAEVNRLIGQLQSIFLGATGRESGPLQTMTFSISPLDDRSP